MTRLVLATLLLAAFVAGAAAALAVLDRLFGGRGPRVSLAPGHRRALDEDWWTG